MHCVDAEGGLFSAMDMACITNAMLNKFILITLTSEVVLRFRGWTCVFGSYPRVESSGGAKRAPVGSVRMRTDIGNIGHSLKELDAGDGSSGPLIVGAAALSQIPSQEH